MRTHGKPPRLPAVIAISISAGAMGVGIATVSAEIAVIALNPYGDNTFPIVLISCAGLVALTLLVALGWPALTAAQRQYRLLYKEHPMSAITGTEPGHWHDEHGHHRMKDPREVYGNHWKIQTGDWSDADERAYARHLIAHESLETTPEVEPGDSELIQSLIAMINDADHTKRTVAALVAALREQQKAKEQ